MALTAKQTEIDARVRMLIQRDRMQQQEPAAEPETPERLVNQTLPLRQRYEHFKARHPHEIVFVWDCDAQKYATFGHDVETMFLLNDLDFPYGPLNADTAIQWGYRLNRSLLESLRATLDRHDLAYWIEPIQACREQVTGATAVYQ